MNPDSDDSETFIVTLGAWDETGETEDDETFYREPDKVKKFRVKGENIIEVEKKVEAMLSKRKSFKWVLIDVDYEESL